MKWNSIGTYIGGGLALLAISNVYADPENSKAKKPRDLTYHGNIEKIVADKCVECHRKGGVAPFTLTSYKDVSSRAATLAAVVEKGAMPPWFAAPMKGKLENCWANDKSLSPVEKQELLTWLKSKKLEGNPKDAPTPKQYDDTWQIGKPDQIIQIQKPIAIKADGYMPYQLQFVSVDNADDKWVQKLEVLPTARSVVHHVLVFAWPKQINGFGRGRRGVGALGANRLDESAGFFAAYVPGNSVLSYPDGFAKKLPKNCDLLFQIHYTPNGKATEDQVKLGMVFAKQPPKYSVDTYGIANRYISIPPGAANHVETASVTPPVPVSIIGFAPHMHLRGKAFKYELVSADGKCETLLDVPKYDFNWQLYYRFKTPFPVPAGAKVVATAVFDNSKENAANPDPNRTVPWGPQTYDEMMLGYVEYFQTNAAVVKR